MNDCSAHAFPACPVRTILRRVEQITGLPQREITGRTRTPELCAARFMIAYIARRETRASYHRIARVIGGRDHTTIIHAERRAAAMMQSEPGFAAMIAQARGMGA